MFLNMLFRLSDISLIFVGAIILIGFYYISLLKSDFKLHVAGQDIEPKQINYAWITASVVLLYMTSAFSTVFWIASMSATIVVAHAALHDVRI